MKEKVTQVAGITQVNLRKSMQFSGVWDSNGGRILEVGARVVGGGRLNKALRVGEDENR